MAGQSWLTNALRANDAAKRLAEVLGNLAGVELASPVEANMVFAHTPNAMVKRLREAGAQFYDWAPSQAGKTLIRLVTSFSTPQEDVENFIAVLKR
ncbi:MAG: hypothetical protein WDM89_14315 [Rhizomicrobium sp.]